MLRPDNHGASSDTSRSSSYVVVEPISQSSTDEPSEDVTQPRSAMTDPDKSRLKDGRFMAFLPYGVTQVMEPRSNKVVPMMPSGGEQRLGVPKERVGHAPNAVAQTTQRFSCLKAFFCGLLLCYCVFVGFVLEKTHVHEPGFIRNQLQFKSFVFIKVVLSALLVTCVAMMAVSHWFKVRLQEIRSEFEPADKRGILPTAVLGGILIGFGFALSASSPLLVACQLGSQVEHAWAGALGMLLGSCLVWVMDPILIKFERVGPQFSKVFLDQYVAEWPPWVCGLVVMMVSTGALVTLEMVFPWQDEFPSKEQSNTTLISADSWAPWAGGLTLGSYHLLQVIFLTFIPRLFTGIQAIGFLPALALPKQTLSETGMYARVNQLLHRFNSWWHLLVLLTICLGSFISTRASTSRTSAAGVRIWEGVVGGMALMLGCYLSNASVFGHCVSGPSTLFLHSFITLPTFLATAIATSVILSTVHQDVPSST
eukprot:m.251953 g.251953  ORF g.251953 m.251953 type:complete len:481 (+) comp15465_c0_seq1:246-1688(+)